MDKLRVMILGIPAIVTDCQALLYLNKNKAKNPLMARWFNLIQKYDSEIKHRPGERMAHVDASVEHQWNRQMIL
uniref:Retrovirus-like protein pol polyprotein n=1 Tax=Triatoma infestans TaxID=30076 RepID=A0A161M266_TRIIF